MYKTTTKTTKDDKMVLSWIPSLTWGELIKVPL